jgi:hypothetical protein
LPLDRWRAGVPDISGRRRGLGSRGARPVTARLLARSFGHEALESRDVTGWLAALAVALAIAALIQAFRSRDADPSSPESFRPSDAGIINVSE